MEKKPALKQMSVISFKCGLEFTMVQRAGESPCPLPLQAADRAGSQGLGDNSQARSRRGCRILTRQKVRGMAPVKYVEPENAGISLVGHLAPDRGCRHGSFFLLSSPAGDKQPEDGGGKPGSDSSSLPGNCLTSG